MPKYHLTLDALYESPEDFCRALSSMRIEFLKGCTSECILFPGGEIHLEVDQVPENRTLYDLKEGTRPRD
jgi:hypothetical protein